MQKEAILITGASGEIGQALLQELSKNTPLPLVTVDLKPLPSELEGKSTHLRGNLLDQDLYLQLENDFQFDLIFHMAALLSTTAELRPQQAHQVNADGTFDLLQLAAGQSQQRGAPVRFLFPSSIAVYGLPDQQTKNKHPRIKEHEWNHPITMYGCTKLYCENLGRYFSEHFNQLADKPPTRLDFRAIRFPGLISPFTTPCGGTSDYGPEMVHAAAKGEPYECFVRAEVRMPFMAMIDAVSSLLKLANAPEDHLRTRVYNVTSFSLSAEEFKEMTLACFPDAEIIFSPDPKRQRIVDSWPADVDDSAAREDWGWAPRYDQRDTCLEYLLPNIKNQYS